MTDKAMTIANRLIRHYPDLKIAYSLRGMLHEKTVMNAALKDYERAVKDHEVRTKFSAATAKIQSNLVNLMRRYQLIRAYQVVLRNPGFYGGCQALLHFAIG